MTLKNKNYKELWNMLDKYDKLKYYVHDEIRRRSEGEEKYKKIWDEKSEKWVEQ